MEHKGNIMIECQLPRGIMQYSKCLLYPSSYTTQMINLFLNKLISVNRDKAVGHSANGKIIIIKDVVTLL